MDGRSRRLVETAGLVSLGRLDRQAVRPETEAEEDDLVLDQGVVDDGEGVIVRWVIEVNAFDLSADYGRQGL
jgi:hypothetical protein